MSIHIKQTKYSTFRYSIFEIKTNVNAVSKSLKTAENRQNRAFSAPSFSFMKMREF